MAKKRILLVDDEPNVLKLLGKRLEFNNYEVATAQNGKEGITKALEWKPDLIVLDLLMPDMDGVQVCNQLKANQATCGIPVVMLTAAGIENAEKIGLAAGAVAVINKPFLLDLIDKIGDLFRKIEAGESLDS